MIFNLSALILFFFKILKNPGGGHAIRRIKLAWPYQFYQIEMNSLYYLVYNIWYELSQLYLSPHCLLSTVCCVPLCVLFFLPRFSPFRLLFRESQLFTTVLHYNSAVQYYIIALHFSTILQLCRTVLQYCFAEQNYIKALQKNTILQFCRTILYYKNNNKLAHYSFTVQYCIKALQYFTSSHLSSKLLHYSRKVQC